MLLHFQNFFSPRIGEGKKREGGREREREREKSRPGVCSIFSLLRKSANLVYTSWSLHGGRAEGGEASGAGFNKKKKELVEDNTNILTRFSRGDSTARRPSTAGVRFDRGLPVRHQ